MKTHRWVDPPTTRACPRGCWIRGRHTTDCNSQGYAKPAGNYAADACAGCLPRHCTPGRWLCNNCGERLTRDIERLPGLHRELEWMLSRHSVSLTGRISGTGETPLYVAEPVCEWRGQIARDARWWARRVATTRRVTPPDTDTVRACCAFLAVHADWATGQPWAHALADVMAQLAGRAYALAYPNGRRRVPCGPCPEAGCDGTLVATVAATETRLLTDVRCDHDPDHEPHVSWWLDLGRKARAMEAA